MYLFFLQIFEFQIEMLWADKKLDRLAGILKVIQMVLNGFSFYACFLGDGDNLKPF